ncbi:hypothetical protein PCK2_000249 [Pneumocystis canis]|nr:hypothetical protein PCK2_000249 [Pneumocystis canis]
MLNHKNVLKIDPAIERYAEMRRSQYLYFKWTPRIVAKVLTFGIIIPLFINYIGFSTEGKWDFRGKGIYDSLTEDHKE